MPLKIGPSIHRYFLIHTPFYQTKVDKEFKWLPFATVFFLDLFGMKTKSGWKKQVLLAGSTEAIRYLITDNLKKLTSNHRPFPYSGHHSFPSGDTSSSFAGAEFMHTELKTSLPVLSFLGYGAGISTGVIRLMKNRHWLKDVLAGAAIGIISAKLAYWLINRRSNEKKKNDAVQGKESPTETVLLISQKIKSPAK